MKRFVVLAAGLAVVAALVCGRSFLATAQQPTPIAPLAPTFSGTAAPTYLNPGVPAPGGHEAGSDAREHVTPHASPAVPAPGGHEAGSDVREHVTLPASPAVPAPAVPAPKDLGASSLQDLVQMLKTVRQQKAELKLMEEKITTTIRQKIEDEKKQHEAVQQLLDDPEEEKPTIGSRR